ncbi:BZ3500_MvSof-1268-A1-R1_Chr12-3g04045 [Microbotryum saponariae]|uniref:BZ3500_MvSof-1268-A1-R1_Chr12-3g04045 protein n=1 Tax=Microbotryum saponariae TaxID=289078 RepID=A0A2X0NBM0_9BASI|nr:BZ3500_MvSof-1268-A1-R1_Chr12-3g04045 [Microbotryum saponariae]SDA02596.1 BZ3501_MvSof-1269-A2-R1_Chr12-3g03700 [Microbotryum saponariae]
MSGLQSPSVRTSTSAGMTRTSSLSSTNANEHSVSHGHDDGPSPPRTTTDASTSTAVVATRSPHTNAFPTSPSSCSSSTSSNSTDSSPLLGMSSLFPEAYPSSPILASAAAGSSVGLRSCQDYACSASPSVSAACSRTIPRQPSKWSSSPHHSTQWPSPIPTEHGLDDHWPSTTMATGQGSPVLPNTGNRMDREALLKGGWSRDRQPRVNHPQPTPQSSSSYEHSSASCSTTSALHESPPSPDISTHSTQNSPQSSTSHRGRMESTTSWLDNDDFDDDLYSLFGAHFNPHHHLSDHTLRASKKSRQDASQHDRDLGSPVSGFKSLGQKASKFSLRSIASAISLPNSSSASATSSTRTGVTGSNASTMTNSPSMNSFHPYPSPPNSPHSQATSSLPLSRRPSKSSSSNSCLSPLPLPLAIPPSLDPIDPPLMGHAWSESQPGGVRGKAARILGEVTVPTGKAARLLGTEQGLRQVKIGAAGRGARKTMGMKGGKGDRYDDNHRSFETRNRHAMTGTDGFDNAHRSSIKLLTPEHSPPRSSPVRRLRRTSSDNELGSMMAARRGRHEASDSDSEDEGSSDVFTEGPATFHAQAQGQGQGKKVLPAPSHSQFCLSTINEAQPPSTTPHLSRRGSIDSLIDSTYHQSWPPVGRSEKNGRVSVVPSLASIALPSIRSSIASTMGGWRGGSRGSSWDIDEPGCWVRPESGGSSWDEQNSPRTPRTPTASTPRFRSSTCDSSIYSTTSSFCPDPIQAKEKRTSSLLSPSEGSLARAQERAKTLLGPPKSLSPVGKLPPLPVPNLPLPPIPDGVGVTALPMREEVKLAGGGGERPMTNSSLKSVGRRSQRGHALEALEGRKGGRRSFGQVEGLKPRSRFSAGSSFGNSVVRRGSKLPGDDDDDDDDHWEEEDVFDEVEELTGFKRGSRPFLDLGEDAGSNADEVEGLEGYAQGADSDSDTISEFSKGRGGSRKSLTVFGRSPSFGPEFHQRTSPFQSVFIQPISTDSKDRSDWVELRSDLLLEALDRTQAELRKVNPYPTTHDSNAHENEDEDLEALFRDSFRPTPSSVPSTPISRPGLKRCSSSFHSDELSEGEGFSPALGRLAEFFQGEEGVEEEGGEAVLA